MVVNRGDIKRKRKVNTCISFLDDSPKRTKVHAQRKFAQGSNVSSPMITPIREIEKQERNRDVLPEPVELLPMKRPNTEDFLTFLCFRGTPILPSSLNYFNTASMIDTRVQTDDSKYITPNNGPIVTHTFNKSPNERPFIAFGVRKRADPVVISKQMDKKRRHALTLQALRRKYQEQKMAKIRAVTISKLSEKITSKSVVRTRSVTKSETITKKNVTQKTNIKVVATKEITTCTTIKQPIRTKIKSKMCLRSFRGRYIHHELGIKHHKKKPLTKRVIRVTREKKTNQHGKETSSEFSSDDDEPLVNTVKVKQPGKIPIPRNTKKSTPGHRKPVEVNYRLTRSHRILLNNSLVSRKQAVKHKRFFSKTGNAKSAPTKIINKKLLQSSRMLKKRICKLPEKQLPSDKNEKVKDKKMSRLTKPEKAVTIENCEKKLTRNESKKVVKESDRKVKERNERNLRYNSKFVRTKNTKTELSIVLNKNSVKSEEGIKRLSGRDTNDIKGKDDFKNESKKVVREKPEMIEVKNEKQKGKDDFKNECKKVIKEKPETVEEKRKGNHDFKNEPKKIGKEKVEAIEVKNEKQVARKIKENKNEEKEKIGITRNDPKRNIKDRIEATEEYSEKQVARGAEVAKIEDKCEISDNNEKSSLKKLAVKIYKDKSDNTDENSRKTVGKVEVSKMSKEKGDKTYDKNIDISKTVTDEKSIKGESIKILPDKKELKVDNEIGKRAENLGVPKILKEENEKVARLEEHVLKKAAPPKLPKEKTETRNEKQISKKGAQIETGKPEEVKPENNENTKLEKVALRDEQQIENTQNQEKVLPKSLKTEKVPSKTQNMEKILPKTENTQKMLSKTQNTEKDLLKTQNTDKVLPKTQNIEKVLPKTQNIEKMLAKTLEKLKKEEQVMTNNEDTKLDKTDLKPNQKVRKTEDATKSVRALSKKAERPKKSEEPKVKIQDTKQEAKTSNSRPTRKTKEAAAIYMEILGHKLVNDAEIDDDDVSIDSFPELPNVRKTEQRENELKAKAKSKANETKEVSDSKSKPIDRNGQEKESTETSKLVESSSFQEQKVEKCNLKNKEKPTEKPKKQTVGSIEVNPKVGDKQIDISKVFKPQEQQNLVTVASSESNQAKVQNIIIEDHLESGSKKIENKQILRKRKVHQDENEKLLSDSDDSRKGRKVPKKSEDVVATEPKVQQRKKLHIVKPASPHMEKRQTRYQTVKPFLDMSFSDSDDSFTIDMKICGTVESKQTRKRSNLTVKKPSNMSELKSLPAGTSLSENKPDVTENQLKNLNLPDILIPEASVTNTEEQLENSDGLIIGELHLVKKTATVLPVDDDFSESGGSDHSSVHPRVQRPKKKTKTLRMKKQLNQSFSDSDEEPLSKLTQSKPRRDEQELNSSKSVGGEVLGGNKYDTPSDLLNKNKAPEEKSENVEESPYVGKPKRECTKKPQNYLPLFSSSDDEEKYFHGFVKSETKTLRDLRTEEEKCIHALPSSDLLCKDIGRRFGKGKVNMSNEQIEKWLNDSAMAGLNIKKENDEMLKFGEKIPTETSLDLLQDAALGTDKLKCALLTKAVEPLKADENLKTKTNQVCSLSTSSTPEKPTVHKLLPKPMQSERKTIFRKEKSGPMRNINAFSANNESSVYAFQADSEDSVSTPFRRPSRRPSSTATSKSEDEASKLDEVTRNSGKFRLPTFTKTEAKSTNKQEVSVTLLSADDPNSASIAVQVNLESADVFPNTSNPEVQMDTENGEQTFYIPLQSGKQATSSGVIQGVAIKMGTDGKCGANQRLVMRAKLVTQSPIGAQKLEDKSSMSSAAMFPPTNTLQKTKIENKSHSKCTSNRTSDRLSETSEDFKYKVPSSPSASSSSSAKLYKRQKSRSRPLELCLPVHVTEFPSIHCLAQMVEAPVFYPNEKEFQDPLEYIEKIRSKANKFGICRIVPPSNFKPECKVSDDMRFTAYNQYVHKMLHRWGPNFKELMAIQKYLQTQNISLTHPPWIGGMEIDLPRLYQTVQLLGGLKEVIEKKKWPKVSEAMKIPRSAQDRVTKLDDIYCKYLLPYDTLSPAEREKLFDEVETEWAKRESKTLLKVQQKISKSETGSESDSDADDESEECIVKGRNMALNAFYRIARNTMSMWFKTSEPSAQEVEQEFWRHVTLKSNHICVHSGSIDSGIWGYGFAVSKNSPFARHSWNLKVLTNNSGSVLRSMGPLMGVTVPTLHVGMVFSACCWSRDPHSLPWIEYLHTGANKIWYGIPDSMSEYFRSTLLKLVPNYCKNKSLWLPSDTVMIPPNLLVENGVSLSRTVQEPGQFVVVFPKVFTSSISTGYVVSESVYFAPPYWLISAQKMFDELRNSCEPPMFSLDRLILSISFDPRSNVEVLRQIIPAAKHICDREQKYRRKLCELGVTIREKLPLPEAPAIRKRKKLLDDNGDYECDVCRTNLFISLVTESHEDVVYCLEHAVNKIETKKVEVKNCKLLFTYDDEELDHLIEKIKLTIDAKLQKKIPGKYAGLPTMLK